MGARILSLGFTNIWYVAPNTGKDKSQISHTCSPKSIPLQAAQGFMGAVSGNKANYQWTWQEDSVVPRQQGDIGYSRVTSVTAGWQWLAHWDINMDRKLKPCPLGKSPTVSGPWDKGTHDCADGGCPNLPQMSKQNIIHFHNFFWEAGLQVACPLSLLCPWLSSSCWVLKPPSAGLHATALPRMTVWQGSQILWRGQIGC